MKRLVNLLQWIMKGKGGVAATLQTFLFQVLVIIINILTGMITARALAPVGRGEQNAIGLWCQFLGSIFALGLGPALLFNLKHSNPLLRKNSNPGTDKDVDPGKNNPPHRTTTPDAQSLGEDASPQNAPSPAEQESANREQESNLYAASLAMGVVQSIGAVVVGIVLMPSLLSQYSADVILYAQWFMVTAPMNLLSLVILNAYKARGMFSVVNQTNYLAPLLTLVLLGILAVTHEMTPLSAALAYRIPFISIFLWKFVDLWKYYQPRFQQMANSVRQLFSYSYRSAGINILSQFADRIDQVLVVKFLPPGPMGLYIVALGLSRMLNTVQNSIVVVLFPVAAARPQEEVVALAGRAARISTLLTLVAAIPLIAFGPWVLRGLYGQEFVDAAPVCRLLSLEIVLKGATLVLAQTFMALGRPGVVTLLQGVGLGLSFPLMIWLIPQFGLLGTGMALLCSTSLRLIFIMLCYPMILKASLPNLIPSWQDFQYLWQAIAHRRRQRA
jgi:O-antigen/teichoic acid export membrane protein